MSQNLLEICNYTNFAELMVHFVNRTSNWKEKCKNSQNDIQTKSTLRNFIVSKKRCFSSDWSETAQTFPSCTKWTSESNWFTKRHMTPAHSENRKFNWVSVLFFCKKKLKRDKLNISNIYNQRKMLDKLTRLKKSLICSLKHRFSNKITIKLQL